MRHLLLLALLISPVLISAQSSSDTARITYLDASREVANNLTVN